MKYDCPEALPISRNEFSQIYLFRNIQFEKLAGFLLGCSVINFNKDETIINPTTSTKAVYILINGLLQVNVESEKGGTFSLTIKPGQCVGEMSVLDDVAPCATIIAKEKSKIDRIALELSGDSAFTTDRGLYAVTSNAWPSNKKFKATFGIDDTIWVKFSETLDPNTDRIQWNYATGMARTIYANGYYANAKSWVKKDTLFVKMLEKILDSRVQGDSVGMNVTVYAQNEMYIKGFMLS